MKNTSIDLAEKLSENFGLLSDLIQLHANLQPNKIAVVDDHSSISWSELHQATNQVAATLQREKMEVGDVIAICASSSIEYVTTFLGALKAGVTVTPLAPSLPPAVLHRMINNAGAKQLFIDSTTAALFHHLPKEIPQVGLLGTYAGSIKNFTDWLVSDTTAPHPVEVHASTPFNIIYSSGTTGEPKGIVQTHEMRWWHIKRFIHYDFTSMSKALLSTPLYSNTTLVTLIPALAHGGTVVLMAKFNVEQFLHLIESHQITHTMLVPVQYQRILASPLLGKTDLSTLKVKLCTSAPLSSDLKNKILNHMPGALVELYGMTEGGGSCMLEAHKYPDKLHTVGKPSTGSDIRLINEDGVEIALHEVGEIVGRSRAMMACYHNNPEATREAEWYDKKGNRFIRTGDIGRFDEDGFLILMDRRKDMIISGGFNIYPSDLESVIQTHPDIKDVAVIGVPSEQWGETPVAFISLLPCATAPIAFLHEWINARLGKTQRISKLIVCNELPRSEIGKILKRELLEQWQKSVSPTTKNTATQILTTT